jgi:multimeric flavodoxin WrbA
MINVDIVYMEVQMNILLLCDEARDELREAESGLGSWARSKGHSFETLYASELKLRPCLGCFACWTKTPGLCAIKGDDGERFLKAFIQSDLFVLLGETPYGSFSPQIKRVLDRIIPSLHPYFRLYRGEMHHVQRYPNGRRVLLARRGDANPAEAATFCQLGRSYCDNVASPYQKRDFLFDGRPEPFVEWIAEEVAS